MRLGEEVRGEAALAGQRVDVGGASGPYDGSVVLVLEHDPDDVLVDRRRRAGVFAGVRGRWWLWGGVQLLVIDQLPGLTRCRSLPRQEHRDHDRTAARWCSHAGESRIGKCRAAC